jgi:hypothetical protein
MGMYILISLFFQQFKANHIYLFQNFDDIRSSSSDDDSDSDRGIVVDEDRQKNFQLEVLE